MPCHDMIQSDLNRPLVWSWMLRCVVIVWHNVYFICVYIYTHTVYTCICICSCNDNDNPGEPFIVLAPPSNHKSYIITIITITITTIITTITTIVSITFITIIITIITIIITIIIITIIIIRSSGMWCLRMWCLILTGVTKHNNINCHNRW